MVEMIYFSVILFINVVGFIMIASDKRRAVKSQWRVPEKRLWQIALFGGAFGEWIAMRLFRHKTKHRTFMIGMPAATVLNMAVFVWIWLQL